MQAWQQGDIYSHGQLLNRFSETKESAVRGGIGGDSLQAKAHMEISCESLKYTENYSVMSYIKYEYEWGIVTFQSFYTYSIQTLSVLFLFVFVACLSFLHNSLKYKCQRDPFMLPYQINTHNNMCTKMGMGAQTFAQFCLCFSCSFAS